MRGCEWMDGKVVERVVGGRWEGSGKMNGRMEWKVVGGWWDGGLEGGGRIVGGVVVALGFLSSCNGDLRDWLVLPQRSQVSFRVERGPSGFLLSHCP